MSGGAISLSHRSYEDGQMRSSGVIPSFNVCRDITEIRTPSETVGGNKIHFVRNMINCLLLSYL